MTTDNNLTEHKDSDILHIEQDRVPMYRAVVLVESLVLLGCSSMKNRGAGPVQLP